MRRKPRTSSLTYSGLMLAVHRGELTTEEVDEAILERVDLPFLRRVMRNPLGVIASVESGQ